MDTYKLSDIEKACSDSGIQDEVWEDIRHRLERPRAEEGELWKRIYANLLEQKDPICLSLDDIQSLALACQGIPILPEELSGEDKKYLGSNDYANNPEGTFLQFQELARVNAWLKWRRNEKAKG